MDRQPHSKSKLRITVKGLLFVTLILAVSVEAIISNNNLMFLIASTLFGIFITSGMLARILPRRMRLQRILPKECSAEEGFEYSIQIENRKWLWPAAFLSLHDQHSCVEARLNQADNHIILPIIKPRRKTLVNNYLIPAKRGWIEFGALTLHCHLPLGLFHSQVEHKVPTQLLALPQRLRLHKNLLIPYIAKHASQKNRQSSFIPGEEEFASIRDYRPGDNPRSIDWRISARYPDQLVVRQYENPHNYQASIFLDTYIPAGAQAQYQAWLERGICFAIALAEDLIKRKYHVIFHAYAPELLKMNLHSDLNAILLLRRSLALLQPTEQRPLGQLLSSESSSRNTVTFVLQLTEEKEWRQGASDNCIIVTPTEMKSLVMLP
jgi:uncharacterized protein (DUF58 family)